MNTVSRKTYPSNIIGEEVAKASRKARRIGRDQYEDNANLFAGYTYLAQLLVHDLTHLRTNEKGGLNNAEDAQLNLSTIFGPCPDERDDIYVEGGARFAWSEEPQHSRSWIQPWAVPKERTVFGKGNRFVLADRRNDDNAILLQLRNFFCLLYEQKRRELGENNAAREAVAQCFRSVVRNDLCQKLLTNKIFVMLRDKPNELTALADKILVSAKQETYREFSFAVGRIGHSMSRTGYEISDALVGSGKTSVINMIKAGKPEGFRAKIPGTNERLWQADWRRLFHLKGCNQKVLRSRRISPLLDRVFEQIRTDSPHDSNGTQIFSPELTVIDLYRTVDGIQSGQSIARRLKSDLKYRLNVMEDDQLLLKKNASHSGVCDAVTAFNAWFAGQPGWGQETPLLMYVLIEAHNLHEGKHLGPVGSFVFGAAVAKGLANLPYDSETDTMPKLINLYFGSRDKFEKISA